jgi:hypothetical protein
MPRLTERQQLAAAMAASAADYAHASGTAVEMAKTTKMTMTTTMTTTTTMRGEHGGVGRGYSPAVRTPRAVNERGGGVGARHGASAGTPRTPASAGATTPATTMVTTPGGSNLYGALQSNKRNRSRQAKELASLAPWAWDPLVGKHAPGPSALRDFSEVVTDKTLMASASGAISSVAVKTFTRFPIDDFVGDAKGRAAAVKQTTGKDAAKVGDGDAAAKAKKPAAATTTTTTTTTTVAAAKTPVTTTTKARDGKKRARTTMGAVTPLKLASTLDEASEREKPTAGTRSSARATAAAAARAVAVQVSNKENAAPKQKSAPLPPPSRAPSRAALTEVKNAPAAPKRKAVEKPTAKAVVAVATAVAPKTKEENNLMFITPVAPAKKKSCIGATSGDDVRRQSYALECLLAKTYVKAIRHPIMPTVKPSRRLLDAYRAFSKSRITPNERVSAPTTELKIGAALERGLDALVAKDARFAK